MRKDFVQKILKIMNLLLIALMFEAAWLMYYSPYQEIYNRYASVLLFVLYCSLYLMYTKIYDGFLILSNRIYELICGQALSALIADGLMFVVIWLVLGRFPNILPMLLAFLIQVAVSTFWSVLVHRWYFSNHTALKALVVADGSCDVQDVIGEEGFSKHFDVLYTITPQELVASDFAQLQEVMTVFICCEEGAYRKQVLNRSMEARKSVYIVPGVEDIILHNTRTVHLFHNSMMRVRGNEQALSYNFAKRAIDIALSLTATVITLPIMVGVAIAIKLDDHGPVFYKQKRLTKDGKEFNILKFRSMRIDAEKDGVARLSSGDNDDRITRVGRFIRKVRLDELPQLLNILSGDMTIVGPRPERPEIAAEYMREIPHFRQRLRVKAGLTGYAQVYGKYNASPRNKLIMDMAYIENRGIWEDLQIMFATVKVLFMPDATEGVAEGQTTALAGKKQEETKK